MSDRVTTAAIRKDSPRAADWLRVFGGLEVPIRSPIAHRAELPGRDPGDVFLLDVAALTAEQTDRLVDFLADRFHADPAEVRADLADPNHGVPILAEDVVVCFAPRLLP